MAVRVQTLKKTALINAPRVSIVINDKHWEERRGGVGKWMEVPNARPCLLRGPYPALYLDSGIDRLLFIQLRYHLRVSVLYWKFKKFIQ